MQVIAKKQKQEEEQRKKQYRRGKVSTEEEKCRVEIRESCTMGPYHRVFKFPGDVQANND